MISSLLKNGEVLPEIKQYGMVIMDECHHAPAPRNERVLNEVNAYYVYGLTATPYRDDGLKKRIFMQFGPDPAIATLLKIAPGIRGLVIMYIHVLLWLQI